MPPLVDHLASDRLERPNALKAGVNLVFNGDLGTVGNNPVAFNGQKGDLRIGLAFDAPLTRRLERQLSLGAHQLPGTAPRHLPVRRPGEPDLA